MRRCLPLLVAAFMVTAAATVPGAFDLESSVFMRHYAAEPSLKEHMPCLISGFQADKDIMFLAEFSQVEMLSEKEDKLALVGAMLKKHRLKSTDEARAIVRKAMAKTQFVAADCVKLYEH